MAGIPFIRDFKFDYGTAMEVTPLIRRVVANNPNPFTSPVSACARSTVMANRYHSVAGITGTPRRPQPATTPSRKRSRIGANAPRARRGIAARMAARAGPGRSCSNPSS